MPDVTSIDFRHPIPLFPLQTCVLLPEVSVRLHIFEPRYRAMVREALDSSGLIAMSVFEGDGWKTNYDGKPPVRPHVCVGYIVQHHALEDGRCHLLLQGLARGRIVRELEHEVYRIAMIEPVEQTSEVDIEEVRRQIETLLWDPLLGTLASVAAIKNLITHELPTPTLIDLACFAICQETEERYCCLAEGDPGRRAAWLGELLRSMRRTLALAEAQGRGSFEDGDHWN